MRFSHAVTSLFLLTAFGSELVATTAAFSLPPPSNTGLVNPSVRYLNSLSATTSSSSTTTTDTSSPEFSPNLEKNEKYIEGLIDNLTQVLDRWVVLQSSAKKTQVQNILDQILRESKVESLTIKTLKLVKRAGFPVQEETRRRNEVENDSLKRQREAEERVKWEKFRSTAEEVGEMVEKGRRTEEQEIRRRQQQSGEEEKPRSALSSRLKNDRKKPDLFMGEIDKNLTDERSKHSKSQDDANQKTMQDAQILSSELVAQAGSDFDGETMGIGGLDDVLAQVKRRVWIPLAAPPILLRELGISPVRGLLLYGRPGCGKTLIARTIGRILSPSRPVTVVSGPELMDKFVGSSEENVRKVFDEPPRVYDHIRFREDGEALSQVALHVIIMDEFDAMARSRGGKSGKGDQGEAGVARDSVVNQLLAKMDGVDPLPVPTLVIGMTNKRSLIDSALLRPGRFEVQIEVPPPRTQQQRVSILKVHMQTMFEAGRLLVRDAPTQTAAGRFVQNSFNAKDIPTYELLVNEIARECKDFSGASLAGVTRAAASHALERAVIGYSTSSSEINGVNGSTPNGANNDNSMMNGATVPSMMDCLVTLKDLKLAIEDVKASSGDSDWKEDKEEEKVNDDDSTDEKDTDESTT
eukprot:CAMPEP_0194143484 /NCGR_PEP_ID=MMETSP0152-20130528/12655_1 /TAXON_ID=1049557 /ORGANISM="Thalassiothrix antarctica, Strain L6-D1" /LENGTH=636 /DNA_ID=CAMNT_0038842927 /DNA_START=157 /DNA_END=2067 /DNA_ORIENTATION=+